MSTRIDISVSRQALIQAAQQSQSAGRRQFVEGQARQAEAEAAEKAVQAERAAQGLAANGEDLRGRRRVTPRVAPKPTANRVPASGGVAGFWFAEYVDEATNRYTIEVWCGDATTSISKEAVPGAEYIEEYEDNSTFTPIPSPAIPPWTTTSHEDIRQRSSNIRNQVFRLPAGNGCIIAFVHSAYQVVEVITDEQYERGIGATYIRPGSEGGECSAGGDVNDEFTTFASNNQLNLGPTTRQWHAFVVSRTAVREIEVPALLAAQLAGYVWTTLYVEGEPAYAFYSYQVVFNHRWSFEGGACRIKLDTIPNPYGGTSNTIWSERPSFVLTPPPSLRRVENKPLHQLGVVRNPALPVPFPQFTDAAGIYRVLDNPALDVPGTPTAAEVKTAYFTGVRIPAASIKEVNVSTEEGFFRQFDRGQALTYADLPEGTGVVASPADRFPSSPFEGDDAFKSPRFHAAWDWDNAAYCRSKLLGLGFSAADLKP